MSRQEPLCFPYNLQWCTLCVLPLTSAAWASPRVDDLVNGRHCQWQAAEHHPRYPRPVPVRRRVDVRDDLPQTVRNSGLSLIEHIFSSRRVCEPRRQLVENRLLRPRWPVVPVLQPQRPGSPSGLALCCPGGWRPAVRCGGRGRRRPARCRGCSPRFGKGRGDLRAHTERSSAARLLDIMRGRVQPTPSPADVAAER